MQAYVIVVVAPGVEYALRFGGPAKDVRIQAFIAKPTIEAVVEGLISAESGGPYGVGEWIF